MNWIDEEYHRRQKGETRGLTQMVRRGHRRCDYDNSLWDHFTYTGNPKPMIAAMRKMLREIDRRQYEP